MTKAIKTHVLIDRRCASLAIRIVQVSGLLISIIVAYQFIALHIVPTIGSYTLIMYAVIAMAATSYRDASRLFTFVRARQGH